jgi:hypothetical protein
MGYLCMMCCALLPERLLRIPKGHDVLALAAFVGICIGMVHSTFKTVARRVRLGDLPGSLRLHSGILAGVVLSPIVLAALAQAYVSYALPELKWVNLHGVCAASRLTSVLPFGNGSPAPSSPCPWWSYPGARWLHIANGEPATLLI